MDKKGNRIAGWLLASCSVARSGRGYDYCSKEITSDEMLLLCFSIAVPACSSIWLDVMFELSAAKSVSSRRPVAAWVLVLMFCRLLYTWSRLFSLAPNAERTVETALMAVVSKSISPLAEPAAVSSEP